MNKIEEMVRAVKWLTDAGYDFSDPYAQVKIPDWVLKGEPNPIFGQPQIKGPNQ